MYAKIFTSLFDGSMRGKSDLILVFVNLLCHSDEDGNVDRHWKAIEDETGLPHDRVLAAIATLEAPDPESRTPTNEGRRIIRLSDSRDWGWCIVNYLHYRQMQSAEQRREYMRKYQQNRRCKQSVNIGKQALAKTTQAEAEAEVDTEAYKDTESPSGSCISRKVFVPPTPQEVEDYAKEIGYPLNGQAWCDSYLQKGWVVGKNKMKDWKAAVRNWKSNGWMPTGGAASTPALSFRDVERQSELLRLDRDAADRKGDAAKVRELNVQIRINDGKLKTWK